MSQNPKRKFAKPPVSSDNLLIEKLSTLIDPSKNNNDLTPLIEFINKGSLDQVLHAWNYFSSANDHHGFTDSTIKINKFLQYCNSNLDLNSYGTNFSKKILDTHVKIIYRGLNNGKPSITNPILRLVNTIIRYQKGSLIDEFFNHFDFTLKSLPKLLVPMKAQLNDSNTTEKDESMSIRYNFVSVLLSILENTSSFQRKEFLINNKKILINWFKYFNVDSSQLLTLTLNKIDSKILQETSFKRVTKCKILNETFLINILTIYDRFDDSNGLISYLNQFILKISTNFKQGLIFNDDKVWLSGSNGASVIINNKTFKIYNKLIYNLVINLRPWSDDSQLSLIINILTVLPELIPPYANYLVSQSGYHDPKLSSFWIGQTLLLTNIINIEIPNHMLQLGPSVNQSDINNNLVLENIIPTSLNKASLIKCLQSESYLIKQLSAQLLVFIFMKLETVLSYYDDRNWTDLKMELIDLVKNELPDLSVVISCLNDVHTKQPEKKILVLILTKLIHHYSSNFPINLSSFKIFDNLLKQTTFSGLDLQLLDGYLSLQDFQNSQNKWWNTTNNSNSLFTSLIMLNLSESNSSPSLNLKIANLLKKLVDSTNIFNKDLLLSQIIPLINSIAIFRATFNSASSKLWKLIDETVSRCVRAPFKYIDQSKDLEKISPFVITLFEQFKFIDNSNKEEYNAIFSWLMLFMRYLIIIGEPKESILKLISDIPSKDNSIVETYLTFTEPNFSQLYKNELFETAVNSSFCDYVTLSPLNKLTSASRLPTNGFDISGILFRLEILISNGEYKLAKNGVSNIILDLLSKIGNYYTSNTSTETIKKLVSRNFWGSIFINDVKQESNEKLIYSSHLLSEILEELLSNKSVKAELKHHNEFNSWINELSSKNLSSTLQKLVSSCIWVLSDDQLLQKISTSNKSLQVQILKEVFSRKLVIDDTKFAIQILKDKKSDEAVLDALSELIESKLVNFTGKFKEITSIVLSNPKYYKLINSLIGQDVDVSIYLVDNFRDLKDQHLLCFIGASLSKDFINSYDTDGAKSLVLKEFFVNTTTFAVDLISSDSFEKLGFQQLLKLFVNSFEYIDNDKRSVILEKCLNIENKSLFSPEIADLNLQIIDVIEKDDSISQYINELIKPWLHKSSLYINKKFAESTVLSQNFLMFVKSFGKLTLKLPLWKLVPKTILNTQLEICLSKWPKEEKVLEYVSIVLIGGSRNIIEFEKLLQIFINNESNALVESSYIASKSNYYTALIIWILFNFDITKSSNITLQDKIILLYSGSVRAEDLLLKDVLFKIESKISKSWINHVSNWELVEEMSNEEVDMVGDSKLISRENNGLVVSLNKRFVKNTIKYFSVENPKLPLVTSNNLQQSWRDLQQFYSHIETVSLDSSRSTIYDSEFLLMLIINNDELVHFDKENVGAAQFDIKKLIESNLLEFIIINLASQSAQTRTVTKMILNGILKSLETNTSFKDRNIFKLLISDILFTLSKLDEKDSIPPLVWCFISRFVPILNNPGHFLYEKAFRLISTNPIIRSSDIPLYSSITQSADNDDDSYYKQVSWLIESLNQSVKTVKDLDLIKFKGVIEWILNLFSSPYLTLKIKFSILEFISTLQNVDSGSDLLVTRFGILTNLEQNLNKLENDLSLSNISTKERYMNEQLVLNIKQLILRFGITVANNRRIREWTFDDIGETVKRLHN